MELLVIILILANIVQIFFIVSIYRTLDRFNPKPVKAEEPKVSDNFQKPKEIYQSTSHIIVPKTPTEIRNQNFNKIKEGINYGDINK